MDVDLNKTVGEILGVSLDKATTRLRSEGRDYRIIALDGYLMQTDLQHKPDRVNLFVEKNVIVDVEVG